MDVPGAPIARPPVRIVTGDLILERWREDDLEPLFAAISDTLEHLPPWMHWAAHHEGASVAEFLKESEDAWKRGDRFGFAIRDGHRVLLGSAGLIGRIGPGGLELGYWVHAAHTRRGVATRAVAVLTEARPPLRRSP